MQAQVELSKKVLPTGLREAIEFIFSKDIRGVALVGGTAISGYYAGHRRSDDMDLFTENESAQMATVKAVQSLAQNKAHLTILQNTPDYFKAECEWKRHHFSIDVVKDHNLFRIAQLTRLKNQVVVADLATLLKMKAATLVSRCSEKDLFDLKWIFSQFPDLKLEDFASGALEIDAGATLESLYMVVATTKLEESACNFSLSKKVSAKKVHQDLSKFQKQLAGDLKLLLERRPIPPLGKLFRLL